MARSRTWTASCPAAYRPREAAELFDALGCPYDAALALLHAPDELALRRALDICNALGAVATARIIRKKSARSAFDSFRPDSEPPRVRIHSA